MNPRHTSRVADTGIIDLVDEIVLSKVLLRPSFFQISNTEITRDKGNFAFGLSVTAVVIGMREIDAGFDPARGMHDPRRHDRFV
jgi:hypothetical protein